VNRTNRNPIRRHGENPRDHFTTVPNELFRTDALSPHAVHLALVIRSHADGYEISQRSLADSLGWRHETVRKYLGELVASRWLAICEYKTAAGKRAFEEYHVHAARQFDADEMARYCRTVTLGVRDETAHPYATEPHTTVRSDRTPLCDETAHKEDHLEEQLEEQEEKHSRYVSNARVPECFGCRQWGIDGCSIHSPERTLVSVGAEEPDWFDSMPSPVEEPPFG
jgi:hypothetical protein